MVAFKTFSSIDQFNSTVSSVALTLSVDIKIDFKFLLVR